MRTLDGAEAGQEEAFSCWDRQTLLPRGWISWLQSSEATSARWSSHLVEIPPQEQGLVEELGNQREEWAL